MQLDIKRSVYQMIIYRDYLFYLFFYSTKDMEKPCAMLELPNIFKHILNKKTKLQRLKI